MFFQPVQRQRGLVHIEFVVVDADGDLVDVEFLFALEDPAAPGQPGLYSPATILSSDGTIIPPILVTGLASADGSNFHYIDWDSFTDVGPSGVPRVWIRATPSDSGGAGPPRTTGPFTVGDDPPVITVAPTSGPCRVPSSRSISRWRTARGTRSMWR
jgi:hypothetical protein